MNQQTTTKADEAPPAIDDGVASAGALREDLASLSEAMEPAFLDDEGPSGDLPAFVNTTNIRELFDWKPGESLGEAIARKNVQKD